jgi:hypothetical protein
MKTTLWLTLTMLLATICFAVPPVSVNYQGKLYDTEGNPVEGDIHVAINLYTNESLSEVIYHEDIGTVQVIGGLYNFSYGSDEENFLSALNHNEVWIELVINSNPLTPKQRIIAVPYALYSQSAQSAQSAKSPSDGTLLYAYDYVNVDTFVHTNWGHGLSYYLFIPDGTKAIRCKVAARFPNGGESRLVMNGVYGDIYVSNPTPTAPYPFTGEMTVNVNTSGWCYVSIQVREYKTPGGIQIHKVRMTTKQ